MHRATLDVSQKIILSVYKEALQIDLISSFYVVVINVEFLQVVEMHLQKLVLIVICQNWEVVVFKLFPSTDIGPYYLDVKLH